MAQSDIIASSDRQKIVRLAHAILDGTVSIIEAARQLRVFAGGHAGIDERHPEFRVFVAIDNETDDLPVGESRRHWAADALAKKDIEIARCEDLYRKAARMAAADLIARYSP
ncbi:MAG: DUF2489 domain-containing protein [Chthoniobacterales bacterium]